MSPEASAAIGAILGGTVGAAITAVSLIAVEQRRRAHEVHTLLRERMVQSTGGDAHTIEAIRKLSREALTDPESEAKKAEVLANEASDQLQALEGPMALHFGSSVASMRARRIESLTFAATLALSAFDRRLLAEKKAPLDDSALSAADQISMFQEELSAEIPQFLADARRQIQADDPTRWTGITKRRWYRSLGRRSQAPVKSSAPP